MSTKWNLIPVNSIRVTALLLASCWFPKTALTFGGIYLGIGLVVAYVQYHYGLLQGWREFGREVLSWPLALALAFVCCHDPSCEDRPFVASITFNVQAPNSCGGDHHAL